jgi:hypothetical protein
VTTLLRDYKEIDAHHEVYCRQRAQIELLNILLEAERNTPGHRMNRTNRLWRLREIIERYPEFEYLAEGVLGDKT